MTSGNEVKEVIPSNARRQSLQYGHFDTPAARSGRA
jgi:hypothetical protein